MQQELRSEVLDALVGFLTTNQARLDISDWEELPTEEELAQFPALRIEHEELNVILRNMAVVE